MYPVAICHSSLFLRVFAGGEKLKTLKIEGGGYCRCIVSTCIRDYIEIRFRARLTSPSFCGCNSDLKSDRLLLWQPFDNSKKGVVLLGKFASSKCTYEPNDQSDSSFCQNPSHD